MSEQAQTLVIVLLVGAAALGLAWRLRRQGAGSSTCAKCSGCGSDDPACVRALRDSVAARKQSVAPPAAERS